MHQSISTVLDRAQGCLVGQAIADALGAPVEGYKPESIRRRYGRITDFLQDHPVGTDDTEYAVLNALILLECGLDLTEADLLSVWQRWLLAPDSGFSGGGFSDIIAVSNLRRGVMSPQSGRFNQQMWSDGLAMAVGPVGIACAGDPERAARVAARLGAVTNGRDGIDAGRAIAAGVAAAMAGQDPASVLTTALHHVPADCWTRRMLERAAEIVTGYADVWSALDALHGALAVTYFAWADIAPEAVALAFGAFLAARGVYRDAVLGGVNLGRDADTIGAIAGTLAGASGGIDKVPDAWRERIGPVPGHNFHVVAGTSLPDLAERLITRFLGWSGP